MQVSKWGNSLAIRLPASVVEALKLKEGDEIDVRVAGERVFDLALDRSRERSDEAHQGTRNRIAPGLEVRPRRGEFALAVATAFLDSDVLIYAFTPDARSIGARKFLEVGTGHQCPEPERIHQCCSTQARQGLGLAA